MPNWTSQDDVIVKMDNVAGSLDDVSDNVSTLNMPLTNTIGKFSVLGTRSMQKAEGNSDVTITMGVRTSHDTDSAHYYFTRWNLDSITSKAGTKTFQIQDPDATAGSFQYDLECYLASYDGVGKTAGDGTPAEHSASLEPTALPTLTIIT